MHVEKQRDGGRNREKERERERERERDELSDGEVSSLGGSVRRLAMDSLRQSQSQPHSLHPQVLNDFRS